MSCGGGWLGRFGVRNGGEAEAPSPKRGREGGMFVGLRGSEGVDVVGFGWFWGGFGFGWGNHFSRKGRRGGFVEMEGNENRCVRASEGWRENEKIWREKETWRVESNRTLNTVDKETAFIVKS